MTDAISGKHVWLTGGSSGIGLALSEALLENGARLWVSSRHLGGLEPLLEKHPDTLVHLPVDLSKPEEIDGLQSKLENGPGHLDYLILNAGTCEYVDVSDMQVAMFRRVMEINYFAAIDCCRLALPLLKKATQRPQIIGVSSLSTVLPFTRAQAYGSSKSALTYFLESLRIDLHDCVDVSVINPGFVETPLTDRNDFDMPFLQTPEKAAEHVLSLMESRKRRYEFPFVFSRILRLLSPFQGLWFWLSKRMLLKSAAAQG